MTQLSIPGMSCGHCKATVEGALSAVPGAGGVAVDLAARTAHVAGDAAVPALLAALDQAGYPAEVTG